MAVVFKSATEQRLSEKKSRTGLVAILRVCFKVVQIVTLFLSLLDRAWKLFCKLQDWF